MAEIRVQRYDLEPVDSLGTAYTIGGEPSPTGEVCMWDEIEPLLAELAELRERTRRRDAVEEPPPEGVWVLGRLALDHALAWVRPDRRMLVYYMNGCWVDENNRRREIVEWWPLLEVSDV